MYCAISFPSPIYNPKTGGVFYDFFVVGTIDDAETVEKRRRCEDVVPSILASLFHRPQVTTETWGGCLPSSNLTRPS